MTTDIAGLVLALGSGGFIGMIPVRPAFAEATGWRLSGKYVGSIFMRARRRPEFVLDVCIYVFQL